MRPPEIQRQEMDTRSAASEKNYPPPASPLAAMSSKSSISTYSQQKS